MNPTFRKHTSWSKGDWYIGNSKGECQCTCPSTRLQWNSTLQNIHPICSNSDQWTPFVAYRTFFQIRIASIVLLDVIQLLQEGLQAILLHILNFVIQKTNESMNLHRGIPFLVSVQVDGFVATTLDLIQIKVDSLLICYLFLLLQKQE